MRVQGSNLHVVDERVWRGPRAAPPEVPAVVLHPLRAQKGGGGVRQVSPAKMKSVCEASSPLWFLTGPTLVGGACRCSMLPWRERERVRESQRERERDSEMRKRGDKIRSQA